MDNKGHREHPLGLEEVRFIPFYNAIVKDSPEDLGISRDNFLDLVEEYYTLTRGERSGIEKQVTEIKRDATILAGVYVGLLSSWDEEMAEIGRSFGLKLERTDRLGALGIIKKKIDSLEKRLKMLETNLPPTPEIDKPPSPYKLLADLSMALEFGLNFKDITVIEYISYTQALKEKARETKKRRNGRGTG